MGSHQAAISVHELHGTVCRSSEAAHVSKSLTRHVLRRIHHVSTTSGTPHFVLCRQRGKDWGRWGAGAGLLSAVG